MARNSLRRPHARRPARFLRTPLYRPQLFRGVQRRSRRGRRRRSGRGGRTAARRRRPRRRTVPAGSHDAPCRSAPRRGRAVVDPHRPAALRPQPPRLRRDAGGGDAAGRLFRVAPDAEPARSERVHLRRGRSDGQPRTRRLPGRRDAGSARRDRAGARRDLPRNRTAAHGTRRRRGAVAGAQHDDGRDDAYSRRAVRHRRRHDRKHPLRPTRRRPTATRAPRDSTPTTATTRGASTSTTPTSRTC